MKKQALVLMLFIFTNWLSAIYIVSPPSGPYYPGMSIGFKFSNPGYNSITWYWGDGTSSSGIDNATFYHTYYNPGTYNIRAVGVYSTQYYSLIIDENRTVNYSPSIVRVGQEVTFTASNFNTPNSLTWNFGDGTIRSQQSATVKYTYQQSGTFTVRVYDFNGNQSYQPVTTTVIANLPLRQIIYTPVTPREEQKITFIAENFKSNKINWNFGDGTQISSGSATVTHRYERSGSYTVQAIESDMTNISPVSVTVKVNPDIRTIRLGKNEVNPGENLKIEARNFYSSTVLWNFGDGTKLVGSRIVYHAYKFPGQYRITAIDEGGNSKRMFSATVRVLGICDEVNLLLAELQFDNGKYYRVVNYDDGNFYARLRIKAKGTGTISGFWLIDGAPFAPFALVAHQGEVAELTTRNLKLPANISGLHTLGVVFNKPWQESVVLPVLKYFVTSQKPLLEIISPREGTLFKEGDPITISWKKFNPASRYEIAFSSNQFSFYQQSNLQWINAKLLLEHKLSANTLSLLPPNQWIYYQVRALDSFGKVLAESSVQEMKIISTAAEITELKAFNLNGRPIQISAEKIETSDEEILFRGKINYQADIPFLILTFYYNDQLTDRLIFRNVRKGIPLEFESSISALKNGGQLIMQIATSASPIRIIAQHVIEIIKNE